MSTKFAKPNSLSTIKEYNKSATKSGNIPLPNIIYRVLTKMGYDSTPGRIVHIQSLAGTTDADKVFSYIDEQLSPNLIDDSYCDSLLTSVHGYTTLNKSRMQLYQEHAKSPSGESFPWDVHILPGQEVGYATFVRGINSKKQLLETMADFWHNHFSVDLSNGALPPQFVHYDRDVFRANAFGNFKQMLLEVTKSSTMGEYLGNAVNNKDEPNENFAREIMELHTLGAENYYGHMPWQDVPTDAQGRKIGYVEEDVVEMARALTGWSYSGAIQADYFDGAIATGEFLYRDDWHDKETKRILGVNYTFDSGNPLKDIEDIIDALAENPSTTAFLAKKLCIRFISDNPSQTIVDAVADSLHQNWQSNEQIKLAMEVLLKSTDFLTTWGEKVKRPLEKILSSMSQMGYLFDFDPTNPSSASHFRGLPKTGHHMFRRLTPDGFPDKKSAWSNASIVMGTWQTIQFDAQRREDSVTYNDIINITQTQFPNANDITANNIVSYWYERITGLVASAHVHEKLSDFMAFDHINETTVGDKNAAIDLSSNEHPTYNKERIYAVVSTMFMTAEFNYR